MRRTVEIMVHMLRKWLRQHFVVGRVKNQRPSASMDPTVIAYRILRDNQYMSVATSDGDLPWVAPVWYAMDDKCDLYFVSAVESRHARHIAENPNVAIAIFNSTDPPEIVDGVQIEGEAFRLDDASLTDVFSVFWKKRFGDEPLRQRESHDVEHYSSAGRSLRKFFGVRITRIYKVDTSVTDVDYRLEVDLVALRTLAM